MEKLVSPELVPNQDVREVIEELIGQQTRPPAGDQGIAAFAAAMAPYAIEHPLFQDKYAAIVEEKREKKLPFTPTYGAAYLERLAHYHIMDRGGSMSDFPIEDTEAWRRVIHEMFDSEVSADNIFLNMRWWDIGSNVAERARPIKTALRLYKDRLPKRPRILEIGASRNHILNAIAGNFSMGEIAVGTEIEEFSRASGIIDNKLIPTEEETLADHVNLIINQAIPIGHSIGVDPWHLRDSGAKLWREACRYPREFQCPRQVAQYHRLDTFFDERVHFICARFPNEDLTDLPVEPPLPVAFNFKFDMVVFSTVWYQQNMETRIAQFDQALKFLRYGGIVLAQDFIKEVQPIEGVEHPAEQLVLPKNWFEKQFWYRTMIFDPLDPSPGFQELLRNNNGRCGEMMLGELALKLLGPRNGAARQLNAVATKSA